jgi:hypothetical protein
LRIDNNIAWHGYLSNTTGVLLEEGTVYHSREPRFTPLFGVVRVTHFGSSFCALCPTLPLVLGSWFMLILLSYHVPFWDISYDFRIKTMFGSSLPQVDCRRVYVSLSCLCLSPYSGVQNFVIWCLFTFLSPCCGIRYDFRINTIFDASLPPVVCRRTHALFVLSVEGLMPYLCCL